MKRGWLLLIGFLFIIMVTLASAKTFNQSGCWGTMMCDVNYTCGTYDSVCTEDFFSPASGGTCEVFFPEVGYMKCLDPDCSSCIEGTVMQSDSPTEPIEGVIVRYEQEVWDGSSKQIINKTTQTDENGSYIITDIGSGNEIYITARKEGYSPDVEILYDLKPSAICAPVNFLLSNGSCEADCTRIGSNYCDAICQGEITIDGGECTFQENTTFLGNPITPPLEACSRLGVQKGSFVNIGNYTNSEGEKICIRVNCCEGIPFEIPCPDAGVSDISSSNSTIENLIKITRIANYKGEPIKLRIYYWEK